MQFYNMQAAERRRNMIPFSMFCAGSDLSWIADNEPIPGTLILTYTATMRIDAANAQTQVIPLTGDLYINEITYAGGDPVAPTLLRLVFKQDSVGGHRAIFPDNVAIPAGFEISLVPNTNTIMNLIYLDARWECASPTVINPT